MFLCMTETTNEETLKKSQSAPKSGRSVSQLLRLLGVLLAIAVILAIAWRFVPENDMAQRDDADINAPVEINDDMIRGDFTAAIASLEAVRRDRTASAEVQALALYNSLGARRASDGQEGHIAEIRDLKQAIIDESLTPETKAILITSLMAQVAAAGNDPAIFDLVFEGAPFASHLVPRDTRSSLRNLAKWSYDTSPTVFAAISLARWQSQPLVPQLDSPTLSDTAVTDAVNRLVEADNLAAELLTNYPAYASHEEYFQYRLWRAAIIGWLSRKRGEPYQAQYRAEYNGFLSFALAHPAKLAREPLPFARYWYAIRLVDDEDAAAAKLQLDAIAQELVAVADSTTPFNRFLRNESARREDGAWRTIEIFARLSPDFKQYVESVVGSPIDTNQQ